VQTHASAVRALTFASHAYDNFHLVMPVFLIREWDGEPVAQEGQTLEFVAPADLKTYPAPEADIPLFSFIEDYASKGGFA
jgi:8-oxo-dGTP diphosphatase